MMRQDRTEALVTCSIAACLMSWWTLDQVDRWGIADVSPWAGLPFIVVAAVLVVIAWRRY